MIKPTLDMVTWNEMKVTWMLKPTLDVITWNRMKVTWMLSQGGFSLTALSLSVGRPGQLG